MSEAETIQLKKEIRKSENVRDLLKGSLAMVVIWALWGLVSHQLDRNEKRLDSLELKLEACQSDEKRETKSSIQRIEGFIISKLKTEN